MDKGLDLSSRLNFDNVDLTAPNMVIEDLAKQIQFATNGIIIGTVKEYSGPIESHSNLQAIIAEHFSANNMGLDIQTTLGKIGYDLYNYEFYLSTPSFEKYMYRICYFQYGIANYPVKVVLEQSIVDSIRLNTNSSYIFMCNNRTELEELITRIIYSERIISIMQELIRINQIHQPQVSKPELINPIEKVSNSNEDNNTQ